MLKLSMPSLMEQLKGISELEPDKSTKEKLSVTKNKFSFAVQNFVMFLIKDVYRKRKKK